MLTFGTFNDLYDSWKKYYQNINITNTRRKFSEFTETLNKETRKKRREKHNASFSLRKLSIKSKGFQVVSNLENQKRIVNKEDMIRFKILLLTMKNVLF